MPTPPEGRTAWTLDEIRAQLADTGVSHIAVDRARALLWIVDRQRERMRHLEDEVIARRRLCRRWEAMFWAMACIAAGALVVILLLLGRS